MITVLVFVRYYAYNRVRAGDWILLEYRRTMPLTVAPFDGRAFLLYPAPLSQHGRVDLPGLVMNVKASHLGFFRHARRHADGEGALCTGTLPMSAPWKFICDTSLGRGRSCSLTILEALRGVAWAEVGVSRRDGGCGGG